MRKKLLVGLGPLAVAVMVAVSAAQGAVPPIKAFPKFFINGRGIAVNVHKPVIVAGTITLHNFLFGNLTCNSVATDQAFNETTEGTEKGFLNTVGYMSYECQMESGAERCAVKNTRGEPEEGIYLTAEAPPVVKGTEIHNAGITSLPWTGELIERETEKTQVLTKHVKLWLVLPPNTVGRGGGCAGTELEFEDREGPAEKAEGYELAPIWVNGSRNGLKPSHGEFQGDEGLTEKGFPTTGRLISPTIGETFVGGPKLTIGGLNGGWELVSPQ
jgi:hypothetical protein